ncbi:DlpA domain-containing protein [Byssothecium circinans]|uniref:DlpA domain-containing protein n=1 Tax=Byssothecium circinans TaxID=147558 RepID=A0A6A5TKP2_9PLEO|nr:DlpA domain-containing protein [Byssothecium circinans]
MSSPRWKELSRYAACDIADALLKLKVPGAGFLPDIAPITTSRSNPKKVIAPASTFLMAPKASPSFPNPTPISNELPASNVDTGPFADHTSRDTIVMISQPAGQSCAVVGGIMVARMKYLGAQGVVVDGRVRDLVALAETGLPIWSKGTSIIGAGAETKFHAKEVPIRIGKTVVEPGDILMIDPAENGVVAIPKAKLDEVLELLPQLVGADEKVMQDVEQGVTVKEAFKRHRNM